MRLEIHWRTEDGKRLAAVVWRPGAGYRMISSGVTGGGIGEREWVLNAQVPAGYGRMDPARHVAEMAAAFGLTGPGTGMLTAARVTDVVEGEDGGVRAAATVGLRVPTWAAAPGGRPDRELAPATGFGTKPGTINIVVALPVPLSDAAFVNAVITATEAKTQAILEAGFEGTGTATDAICVAAPVASSAEVMPPSAASSGVMSPSAVAPADVLSPSAVMSEESFAGPRSPWGARIARAVHMAVHAGAKRYSAMLDGAVLPEGTVPPGGAVAEGAVIPESLEARE